MNERRATAGTSPRRLVRERDGRLVAGVAAGLADHLAVEVLLVRIGFVLLLAAGGLGGVLYAAFWAVVPVSDSPGAGSPRRNAGQLLALGALAGAVLLVTQLFGYGAGLLWPASAAAVGAAILWRQADDAQRERWRTATSRLPRLDEHSLTRRLVLRSAMGLALVAIGMTGFIADHGALPQARRAILPMLVVAAGLTIIAGPWMLHTTRELTNERRARRRAQERAEFAAHVHDSVLQTLTLIQRHAADPATVTRLARGSERELRGWLYTPPGARPATVGLAVAAAAAEVEDAHGVTVDVVTVGALAFDDRVEAVVLAAREAMVNAAKSSGVPSVSVFVDASGEDLHVFVRDRGRGFDVQGIPADRFGVRESIVGRMSRNGGSADIRSNAAGTEVHLTLPARTAARA